MQQSAFSDKILECAECGNQFVWTVAQQRQQYEVTGSLQEPETCPVCTVRLERMRQPAEAVASARGGYAPRASTEDEGFQTPQMGSAASSSSPVENRNSANAEGATSSYVSGTGHPLYGHGGEEYTGHVKWFNDRKGFGFITLDNGIEIFVHYSGIEGEGYKTLKQGQRVRIEVEDTDKGPQATRVRPIAEENGESPSTTDEA
jgi:CspA family cold shock protein